MKKSILIVGCIISCFILVSLAYQPIIADNKTINNNDSMVLENSINIMHPNEKSIYLGWMSTYLGFTFPDMDYTIILGKNIYNRIYGFLIVSDSNLSYIDIYVNEKLEMTLYEPTDYDGICQEWQVHWCPRGYNEIRLMAIDQYNNRFNAYRNLLVI